MVQVGVESENHWRPAKAGADILEWITVPGTNVHLQVMKGWPSTLLGAAAADVNAYIEPLRDADSASFTPTNSVATSNHLNGTAMDLNWNSHPFHVKDTFNAAQRQTIRELLDFYEGTIFWAGDWEDPIDEMHWQMGYDTWNNPATADFIARKIRPDGFSTFRRGDAPSRDAVAILSAATGLSATKAAQILPTLSQGLTLAQCNTVNRIAMFIAQTRHESDNYNTTVEYGAGQRYAPYIGRTWIQVTWQSNYAKFGQWAASQGLIGDPNQFVNDPESLADIRWAGIGAAWYWITPHGGHNLINDDCDAGDVEAVTYTINGGYNGLTQRTAYWNQARAQGDALLTLLTTGDEDDMAGWDQAKVDRAMVLLENMAGVRRPSRSGFRWPGEGDVDTCAGFAWSTDGNEHMDLVIRLAEYGDTQSLALLMTVAACATQFPERKVDAALAQRVLDKLNPSADAKAAAAAFVQSWLDAEKASK